MPQIWRRRPNAPRIGGLGLHPVAFIHGFTRRSKTGSPPGNWSCLRRLCRGEPQRLCASASRAGYLGDRVEDAAPREKESDIVTATPIGDGSPIASDGESALWNPNRPGSSRFPRRPCRTSRPARSRRGQPARLALGPRIHRRCMRNCAGRRRPWRLCSRPCDVGG